MIAIDAPRANVKKYRNQNAFIYIYLLIFSPLVLGFHAGCDDTREKAFGGGNLLVSPAVVSLTYAKR